MVYRPAQVYNGSGWDDVGDKRMLTHDHSGGADGTNIPQSSVTDLTSDLASKLATTVTTKGDLISRTTSAPTRLPVGSNGQVLTANSGTTTGLEWTTPSVAGLTLVTSQTFSAVSSVSVNNCFTSDYANYRLVINWLQSATVNLNFRFRASGSDRTNSNYGYVVFLYTQSAATSFDGNGTDQSAAVISSPNSNLYSQISMDIYNPELSTFSSSFAGQSQRLTGSSNGAVGGVLTCTYTTANSNDGFSLYPSSGTMTGTLRVYGYKD